MDIGFEIIFLFFMILLMGLFNFAEVAILASRRARLKTQVEKGHRSYGAVLKLLDNPGPFLSTIQIGITLIGILEGVFGGAALSEPLAEVLKEWGLAPEYASVIALVTMVLAITYILVVIGELVPKRIALLHPELMAARVIHVMKVVSWIFYPVERLLTFTTDFLLWVFRIKANEGSPVTGEEIKVMIREGRDHGVFHELEQDVMENVLVLDAHSSRGILTPRVEVVYIEKDATVQLVTQIIKDNPDFTYFPICDDGMDHVLGVIDSRKVLLALVNRRFTALKDFIEPAVFVPFSLSGLDILKKFRESKPEILFIVDEYGGILGIMTFEDLLERIFGQESQPEEDAPRIEALKDGSYEVDGGLPIQEFMDFFEAPADEEDDSGEYHTFAGFILRRMGQIPERGHYFFWKNFYFEVAQMDGNRVDKVIVRRFHHSMVKKNPPAD